MQNWTNKYNLNLSSEYYCNKNILDFINFLPIINIKNISDNIYYHFLGLYFLYDEINKNYYLSEKYLLKSINNINNIKNLNIFKLDSSYIINISIYCHDSNNNFLKIPEKIEKNKYNIKYYTHDKSISSFINFNSFEYLGFLYYLKKNKKLMKYYCNIAIFNGYYHGKIILSNFYYNRFSMVFGGLIGNIEICL